MHAAMRYKRYRLQKQRRVHFVHTKRHCMLEVPNAKKSHTVLSGGMTAFARTKEAYNSMMGSTFKTVLTILVCLHVEVFTQIRDWIRYSKNPDLMTVLVAHYDLLDTTGKPHSMTSFKHVCVLSGTTCRSTHAFCHTSIGIHGFNGLKLLNAIFMGLRADLRPY